MAFQSNYPQMFYPQGAYPQPGFGQGGWPGIQQQLPMHMQMPMTVPPSRPDGGPDSGGGGGPGNRQTLVQQTMPGPYGPVTYTFSQPQALQPQSTVETQQPEPEPGMEEAKMTMLAQYYKNPIYGLKANLARIKAEKHALARKAMDDRKSMERFKGHLSDEYRAYKRDKKAVLKRERYWKRTAPKEGTDGATIATELQTLAIRKRQLLDTREYIQHQQQILRQQMKQAKIPVSESESDSSSSSSSNSSRSKRGRQSRKGRSKKGDERSRRSKRSSPKASSRYNDSALPFLHRSQSAPPERFKHANPANLQPLHSTVQQTSEIKNADYDADDLLGGQHSQSAPLRPNSDETAAAQRPFSQARPSFTRSIAEHDVTAPQVQVQRARPARARARTFSFPIRNRIEATSPGSQPPPSDVAAIIKLIFASKESFLLSLQQLSFDAPNALIQVLQENQHRLKPGKQLKVPIPDRSPAAFSVIQAYLSGESILPLSKPYVLLLAGDHFQAYKLLMQEARFYDLKTLQSKLEPYLREKGLAIPLQMYEVAVPAAFVLVDLSRKGQTIDLADLQRLGAGKLSRARVLKTLPRVRSIVTGAALNLGFKIKDADRATLQYSIAIPPTPLSLAFREILRGIRDREETFFIEGEVHHSQAENTILHIDYISKRAVKRKTGTLAVIMDCLDAASGQTWHRVYLDTFRLMQVGGETNKVDSGRSTPAFGVKEQQGPPPRVFANLPIATLSIDFVADPAIQTFRVEIKEILSKTRELEEADGYHDFASQ